MDQYALPDTLHGQEHDKRFVITIGATLANEFFVRSCEISGKAFRNRTSFGPKVSLEQAFCPRFASALAECLGKLKMETEVLSLPSFLLEIPGLTLSGVQIMATRVHENGVNIIMRFKSFIGGINAAFKESIGFDDYVPDRSSDLAAKILSDIAAPLLDICTLAESDLEKVSGAFGAFGHRVSLRSHELIFQSELLKRFVKNNAQLMSEPRNYRGGVQGTLSDPSDRMLQVRANTQ
ncbi:MAG: hypothetical protein ACJA1F_000663 [Paracoccaceae bacterium]|jgi:hypothetical protein